jgi:hypothetical protein
LHSCFSTSCTSLAFSLAGHGADARCAPHAQLQQREHVLPAPSSRSRATPRGG